VSESKVPKQLSDNPVVRSAPAGKKTCERVTRRPAGQAGFVFWQRLQYRERERWIFFYISINIPGFIGMEP
jgi:hypothetical protein